MVTSRGSYDDACLDASESEGPLAVECCDDSGAVSQPGCLTDLSYHDTNTMCSSQGKILSFLIP